MFDEHLRNLAAEVVRFCGHRDLTLASAESCTGGLVAALVTEIPGSSKVFDRGFVTYSNDAKTACLGVAPLLLEEFGAVSREVARAMADGALAHSNADIVVSITGIAGPTGGSLEKPVGLVYFGYGRRNEGVATVEKRFGDLGRGNVRLAAVMNALELVLTSASLPCAPP